MKKNVPSVKIVKKTLFIALLSIVALIWTLNLVKNAEIQTVDSYVESFIALKPEKRSLKNCSDVLIKRDRKDIASNACKLYYIPSKSHNDFNSKSCSKTNLTKYARTVTDSKNSKINFLKDKNELIKCISYYFKSRQHTIKQAYDDKEALKLNLQIISRQLCLTELSIDLNHFSHLSLTKTYKRFENGFDNQAFERRIEDSKFCITTPKIFVPPNKGLGTGLGARLHYFVQALSSTLSNKNPMSRIMATQQGNWLFAANGTCASEDHRCFFEPYSSCYLEKGAVDKGNRWFPENLDTNTRPNPKLFLFPKEYEHKGFLWFNTQILFFIMQPNKVVGKLIRETDQLHSPKFELNTVVTHIRHGDKYTEEQLYNLESYLRAIRKFNLSQGSSQSLVSVYVITDNPNILTDLKHYENSYKFFYTSKPKTFAKNLTALEKLSQGEMNGYDTTVDLLQQIYLALKGNYFVGTFNSNFSRLIFKLMSAVKGKVVENYSLSPFARETTLPTPFGCSTDIF